jgi:hypothetical protein
MNTYKNSLVLVLTLFLMCCSVSLYSCSMYKVTVGNKTLVGCNEDAWRLTSRIWFETAKNEGEYGAAFTGSRQVGDNKFAPQSGMNEVGLVFSRLVAYHPEKITNQGSKKHITDEVTYLTNILHACKTIQEVKDYITRYDRTIFIDDVFIYVDQFGDYLVVEPYEFIEGNDSTYVLANFCPSLTSNEAARKQTKYKKGEDFLKIHPRDTTLGFCIALSDTMHLCRNRNGDGTLLTSIWDTHNGSVNLYFYHRYDTTIQYNLSEELALGDHIISIPSLFPENTEFERLAEYKTPFNMPLLRYALVVIGGLMLVLSLFYVNSYRNKKMRDKFNHIKLFFAGLNILLFVYLFVLATNRSIFYFDAPYDHYSSLWISFSSYIPFLLLLTIIPFTLFNIGYLVTNNRKYGMKSLLVINNILFLILMIAFSYWGLFDFFN